MDCNNHCRNKEMTNKKINVLLIEDNPGDVRLIEEMLSEVSGTTFNEECVDRLSSGLKRLAAGGIDLILLDLGLFDSSGLETFIRVYEQSPQVPIIVLSGLDDEALAVDSVRRGAQDYIIKGQVDSNLLGRAMHYAIERKKAEEALYEREERFRALFDNMKSGVAVYEAKEGGKDFIFTDFNKAAEKIDKTNIENLRGRSVLELFSGVKDFGLFEVFQRVWKTGKPEHHPLSFYKDDRIIGWRENYVYKLPSGEIVAVYDDVTDRKRAEEQIRKSLKEKEVLLREIHHRVKNNLQVISSLLNMQAQTIKDKNMIDLLSESRERINAMALIHSQLYEGNDLSEIRIKEFVDRLLSQLLWNYSVKETRITPIIHVSECPLPISVAVPLGLIINELISNVFKHAFNKREKGIIEISLHASKNRSVSLTVSDDGVGLPPGFDIGTIESLGLRLIKILTEDQLQGKLQVINKKGATFIIEFDMEDNGGV